MLNATERKALMLSAFASSCICFAPGEIVSGTLLLLASAALWRWDERMLRREAAQLQAPQGSAETSQSTEPVESPVNPGF